MKIINKHSIVIALTFWSFLVLFVMSPDSPIHGPWMRTDSACFYMAGKAWMNGLTPYVDFSDSKGPLLWLIYGISYLISPGSYWGIYIISAIFYTITFYYNFKIANIFLHNKQYALAITLLMTLAYFGFDFHFEIRVEDFATSFLSIALYQLFIIIYSGDNNNAYCRLTLIGCCFTAALLMKFSIAIMFGIIILLALWYYICEQKQFIIPLSLIIGGGIGLALPFFIYLALVGAFFPFVNEYFLTTVSTADALISHWGGDLGTWTKTIVLHKIILLGDKLWALILLGGGLLGYQLSHYKWVPILIGFSFYFLSSYHFGGYYYYGICCVFIIYLLIALFQMFKPTISRKYICVFLLFSMAWGIYENRYGRLTDYVIWHDSGDKTDYGNISAIISERKKPMVLYYKLLDYGFGLENVPLPVGKYWMCQNGYTQKMEDEQKKLLYTSKADFIIMNKLSINKDFTIAQLEKMSYRKCYVCTYYVGGDVVDLVLFKKIHNKALSNNRHTRK